MVILDEVRDSDEPEAIGGNKSPLRRCIVTAAVQAKDGMIRFVVAPDGTIVPDLEERLPGRGFWVTADRPVLAKAVSKRLFARAARRAVRVDPELAGTVADLLRGRCLGLLGLARRGGQAVAGFEKVREMLKAGKAAVLIGAVDGAEDGRSKLRALAGGLPEVALFEASVLGAALGRDITVHAALAPGRLAERFLAECRRYAGFAPGRMNDLQLRPGAGERNQTTS
ncbi:MAG TPA: RNA-binding protein [Arenibaculum sp.]|nr:RNA-binding protein [Arenibaculum sp.]